MSTLDLNAYGVEEMNGQEALATNGGVGWVRVIIIGIEILGIIDAVNEFVEGVKEGYDDARNKDVDAVSGAS